jgi:FkbM family methyltransferase
MDRDLIIDVGMHNGSDTAFYLAKGFRVVAIEANPALVAAARSRFAEALEAGLLTIVDKAIAPSRGALTLHVHLHRDDWSTTDGTRWAADDPQFKTIEVDAIPFDDVLAEYGVPYYLKVDIEGAEIHVIESLHRTAGRPRFLSVEAGQFAIAAHLYVLGYRQFKLIQQAQLPRMRLPQPALEGRYVETRFTGHHSGPFGEESLGDWVDLHGLVREFHDHVLSGRSNWQDIHAKWGPAEAVPTGNRTQLVLPQRRSRPRRLIEKLKCRLQRA